MVATPPVRLVIDTMRHDDLHAVQAIEKSSFRTPWPPHAYRQELQTNRLPHYLVVRVADEGNADGGPGVGDAEAHGPRVPGQPRRRPRRGGARVPLPPPHPPGRRG